MKYSNIKKIFNLLIMLTFIYQSAAFGIQDMNSKLRPPVTGVKRAGKVLDMIAEAAISRENRIFHYIILDKLARQESREVLKIFELLVSKLGIKAVVFDDEIEHYIYPLATRLSDILPYRVVNGDNTPLDGSIILITYNDHIDVGEVVSLKTDLRFSHSVYRMGWDISFRSFHDGTVKDIKVSDRSAVILADSHSLRGIPTVSMEFINKLLTSENLGEARLLIKKEGEGLITSLGAVDIYGRVLKPGDIIYYEVENNPGESYPAEVVGGAIITVTDDDGDLFLSHQDQPIIKVIRAGDKREIDIERDKIGTRIYLLSKEWQRRVFATITKFDKMESARSAI